MKESLILKNKFNIIDVFLYLVLIPFLYPRGFSEYFYSYKLFFTIWLYFSLLLILIVFIYKICSSGIKYKKYMNFVLIYHILFIFSTLLYQKGITEGLQKLFMAPTLCIFFAIFLRNNSLKILKCIFNIITVNFFLTITIFNPYIFKDYFNKDTHILFVGHVQVVSQLVIVALFISYLLYNIEPRKRWKSRILVILSIIIVFMANTSAAFSTLIILAIGKIILYLKRKVKFLSIDSKIIVIVYIISNILLIYCINNNIIKYSYWGMDFTFNGRTVIWKNALQLIHNKFWLGYGAYGVTIKTYWSQGMNYAHNEFLQRLLDGGVLLLIMFNIMLLSFVDNIKKIKNKKIINISNIYLIAILFIMIFESTTEYYYIYILLSILAYLPEISKKYLILN